MKHAQFYPARGERWQRLLSTLTPSEIGHAIEALIARLDVTAGDPDLEDDDPAGGAADDIGEEGNWPETDDGRFGCYVYGADDHEDDEQPIRRPHLQRIQRTRCDRLANRFGDVRYRLRDVEQTPAQASRRMDA